MSWQTLPRGVVNVWNETTSSLALGPLLGETSETSHLTLHTSNHLQRAAASRQDTTRRTATAGDLAALVTATTDTTAITTRLQKKLQVGEFVEP